MPAAPYIPNRLSLLQDVGISAPSNGQVLTYQTSSGKWINAAAPSSPPGGSSGQVQYNASGSFGGAAFSVVAASGNLLTLTAQADSDTPLTLKAHSGSQSSGYLQCLSSTNQLQGSIFGDGSFGTGIYYFLSGGSFTGGSLRGSELIADTGGGFTINVGSGGQRISLPATGSNFFIATNASFSPIVALGQASQSAPLQLWQDNSNNTWEGVGAPNTTPNTSFDGLYLVNPTAATSGNQSFSPRLRLMGQGWKTTSTAASQTVDWIIENQPVQGTANPSGNLVFSSQINGGGYVAGLTLPSSGGVILPPGSNAAPAIQFAGFPTFITCGGAGNGDLTIGYSNTPRISLYSGFAAVIVSDNGLIGFNSTTSLGNGSLDAYFTRYAAGIVGVNNSLFLKETSTPSTPTGGGILYTDSGGNLYYLSPGGTSTKLASN